MPADPEFMDTAILEGWLSDAGERLAEALETSRVEGERLDHVIGLLILLGVPKDTIAAHLPRTVVHSRHKVLGPVPVPGLLARAVQDQPQSVWAETASRPAEDTAPVVVPETVLAIARTRMTGPQQSAVLDKAAALAAEADGDREFSAPQMQKRMLEDGRQIHVETVREALNKLVSLHVLDRTAGGRYAITNLAIIAAEKERALERPASTHVAMTGRPTGRSSGSAPRQRKRRQR